MLWTGCWQEVDDSMPVGLEKLRKSVKGAGVDGLRTP
jgi:hypothetical protein